VRARREALNQRRDVVMTMEARGVFGRRPQEQP
jgi:hypothetical protein